MKASQINHCQKNRTGAADMKTDRYRVARYFDDTWEAWVSEPTSKEEAEEILKGFEAGHYVTYDVRKV